MTDLGVNIDHVATIRQARRTIEPDPLWAAVEAQLGGADLITVHLREDRRHIQDRDVMKLGDVVHIRLNLEMAATDEMGGIARKVRPHMVTLVPEGRKEITTEGGLDVAARRERLAGFVGGLREAGILTSAFIDAEPEQVEAAAACGFDACEVHTGPFAEAFEQAGRDQRHPDVATVLGRVRHAGELVRSSGMRFNAGHALTYVNVRPIATLPGLSELHIGHSIISRAVFVGLRAAVAEMKKVLSPES